MTSVTELLTSKIWVGHECGCGSGTTDDSGFVRIHVGEHRLTLPTAQLRANDTMKETSQLQVPWFDSQRRGRRNGSANEGQYCRR